MHTEEIVFFLFHDNKKKKKKTELEHETREKYNMKNETDL